MTIYFLKTKKRWAMLIVIAALVCLAGVRFLELVEVDPDIPSENEGLSQVLVEPVRYSGVTLTVNGTGTSFAVRREFLEFGQSGKVIFIGTDTQGNQLKEGSYVKGPIDGTSKGQLLAHLDLRTQNQNSKMGKAQILQSKSNVDALESELQRVQANVKLEKKNYKRSLTLHETGSVSKSQLEIQASSVENAKQTVASLNAQLLAAKAGVTGAVANYRQIKVNNENTALYAPFDGLISFFNIKLGNRIQPSVGGYLPDEDVYSSSPIVIIDPSVYEIELDIPENLGKQITPGLSTKIRWTLSTPSLPGVNTNSTVTVAKGKVYSVSPSVHPVGRFVRVKVRTTETLKSVMDGMMATCEVEIHPNEDALVVPLKSIVTKDVLNHVFIVEKKTRTAHLTKIAIGNRTNQHSDVEVLEGLKKGDWIIVDGWQSIVDGQKVSSVFNKRIKNEK